MKKNIIKNKESNITVLKTFKFIFLDIFDGKENSNHQIPTNINQYELIKKMNGEWTKKNSLVGVYANKNGKKAFVKIIWFKKQNLQYYKLKQEIIIYKQLSSRFNKLSSLRFPKYIYSEENSNSLLLMIEYIEGKNLNTYSFRNKALIFENISNSLEIIDKRTNELDREILIKRTLTSILLLYPFTLSISLLRRSGSRKKLIKGLLIILKNIKALTELNKLSLSHRDSHLKNFIINKKGRHIIDLETLGYTIPYYDIAYVIEHELHDLEFVKRILSNLEHKNKENKNFKKYIQALIILIATHSLTANDFTKKEITKIEKYLNFGLNYIN